MQLEKAYEILRKTLKQSHIDGQMHLDFSVLTAQDRPEAQEALMHLQHLVATGELDQAEMKMKLGL